MIDAHVGEQIDVRHAERLFQHGAEIGSRDADGVRSGGLRVLKVVVGAGIEHGVDDDGVPCLHFAGGAGHAAFERLPDGIVIGGKRDAVRRGADDAVRVELLKDVVQLGLAHAAEIKGKEQPCRAGGEEGLELPVGDRRLENKDRQIIVDPLRPGEQQREARGRERAAALQIGQQIIRHLVRAGYGQPDGRAGVRHGNRVAECVLHALRGEIAPVKPDGGDAGTRLVPGVGAFEQNKHTVDVVFPQHADKFGDADERRVAVEHDDLRLGGLDCVHSNAGIVANDDTVDMPFESWNRMVSVNFTGMFLVDQAAAVSLLTLVVRIFDAFNDPIIGSIADRTKSRWGRYRPWFMVGSIMMAILIVLQFACNPNWSMTLRLA